MVAGSEVFGFRVWRFDPMAGQWVASGPRLSLFGCGDLAHGKVADLDGDGLPEFVAIGSHNNCGANVPTDPAWNRVSVFTAVGVEMVPAGDFPAGLAARRLELVDYDGDGVLDLVVAADEDMMAFRGLGDRTFAPPVSVPKLADFNGTPPFGADIDLDGVGEVMVEDYLGPYTLLMGWPTPEAQPLPDYFEALLGVADVDDDGRPDFVSRALRPDDRIYLVLTLSSPAP